MKTFIILTITAILLTGCETTKPYDYTNYVKHHPKSILVLPPINESNEVAGTYSYYSTISKPLGELGYYVFPIGVIDRFFKENGMPNPADMHSVALDKIDEIYGADSVLYIILKEYGTEYKVLTTTSTVIAEASLIDVETGIVLWSGTVKAIESSDDAGGGLVGMLVNAAVTQIVGQTSDRAHLVSKVANIQFQNPNHLLPGPYKPQK